jgi:hypothetical protein
MTAITGRRQLTYHQRQKLFRKTPRNVRSKTCSLNENYQTFIESFAKDDYQSYEKIMNACKRVDSMLKHCATHNVQGPMLELAIIRSQDLRLHQKLLQVLRHRWTDKPEMIKKSINQDADKFWIRMASSIQRRCIMQGYQIHPEWEDSDDNNGKENLIKFLKNQYQKQQGKCAISKEAMSLTVGERGTNRNKCSPDRKNSDKGYTPDNIWFVAWWANQMKMDMPMNIFWQKVSVLAAARGLTQ